MKTYKIFFHVILLPFCFSLQLSRRTAYNETEARILLNLSAGAYSQTPDACVKRTLAPNEEWHFHEAKTTECDAYGHRCSAYVVRSDIAKQLIVVFRGTENKEQLRVETWQSLLPNRNFLGVGKANRYFVTALEALWPYVQQFLGDPAFRSYPVTFTGHSLGGALASLAALKTAVEGIRTGPEIKLVTFGQPRVGDLELARRHDEILPYSFRVVYRHDIVPHLPPCKKSSRKLFEPMSEHKRSCITSGHSRAYHHGIEIWYPRGMDGEGDYIECLGEPRGEDASCSNSVSFKPSEYMEYIYDHIHYFVRKVHLYGQMGCPKNYSESSAEETGKNINKEKVKALTLN